ncbi:MAG TPA: hypothetical protein VFF28_00090 [Candidatus Nanoarchaeia archaeon]|nr:hypothetical protein [Candidatus Nanoarchaeia archaeon]
MSKARQIFTNIRVIILLVALVLAVVAINPNPWNEGVAIRSVVGNSSANLAGIQSPKPNVPPMSREVITAINNRIIKDVDDYNEAIKGLRPNSTFQVKTNKDTYRLIVKERYNLTELNETETKTITEIVPTNQTINGTVVQINKTISRQVVVPKTLSTSLGPEDIGLRVYEAPKTNLRKGLDLQGGTRVLLQPEQKISENDMDNLIDVMTQRLNVYGLSDLVIRKAGDLSGNQYILVEIAGATEDDVKNLLANQGKFEATISNLTVFRGGQDITYVCMSADCAGIDPMSGCGQAQDNQWICNFRFSISLSTEAAQRQADITRNMQVITEDKKQYLDQKLNLILDEKQVDELRIGAELKGKAETNIAISGSGVGLSEQEAAVNALQNMKRLQTILITGSLPFKLNVVKVDTISPTLGEEFVKNSMLIGLLCILVVSVMLFIRYRKLQISIPIIITLLSEVLMLMGIAALIGWNLDLASIAGIIIMLGTSVNDQVIITDETLMGEGQSRIFNWKERIKRAFFIVVGAYLTITFAMIPLLFAGAGLLKGFAITTIIGVTVGILVTRPAFANFIEILLK